MQVTTTIDFRIGPSRRFAAMTTVVSYGRDLLQKLAEERLAGGCAQE
jgi:hypothetical protein